MLADYYASMKFQVEEWTLPSQVNSAMDWIQKAIGESYSEEATARTKGASEKFLSESLGKPETIFLAGKDEKGQLAGLIFVGRKEEPFLGAAWPFVYLLYTAPQFRRQGLATSLLEKAEQILSSRGIHKLSAFATHNDDAIISMGERRGYLREHEWMFKEI